MCNSVSFASFVDFVIKASTLTQFFGCMCMHLRCNTMQVWVEGGRCEKKSLERRVNVTCIRRAME